MPPRCLYRPRPDAWPCQHLRPCPVHRHEPPAVILPEPRSQAPKGSPAFEPRQPWRDGQRTYGYDAYRHPTYAEQKRRFEHLTACATSGRISRAERSELAELAKLF